MEQQHHVIKVPGKKVLVLGSTGKLGIYFCKKALEHGQFLTIYARSPSKLPKDISEHPNVKIIEGKLNNEDLLSSAVQGQDAIISILGPTVSLSSRNIAPGTFTNPYRTIFAAMRKHGIKRIFAMGTPSIHDPSDHYAITASIAVLGIMTFAHSAWKEVVAVGELLKDEATDLDWTIFRMGFLRNQEGTLNVSYIGDKEWSIATYRPDVAAWLVEQLEKDTPEYVRERPCLSSSQRQVSLLPIN